MFICPTQCPYGGPADRLIVLDSSNVLWLAPLSGDPPAGEPARAGATQLQFEVTAAASYVIWCRLRTPDASPVALAVSVDGGPEETHHLAATVPSADPDWFWARIDSVTGGPQLFGFGADFHLLGLRPLEEFEIDRVALSSDPNFVPTARLPASGDAVSLTLQPRDRTLIIGRGTTLVAAAVGTDTLFFQRYKDGEPMPDETSPILTIPSACLADSGAYTVAVWSGTALTTSDAAMVQVIAGPPQIKVANFSITQDQQSSLRVTFEVPGEIGSFLTVYASDDLVSWFPIGSQLNSEGTITIDDPAAASMTRRFYRLGSNAGEK